MHEKRRYERLPIKLNLEVSNLFKQDTPPVQTAEHTEIEVFDISKAGIGFMSETELPVGYYFNARLEFETTDEIILSVVKILYVTPIGDCGYRYGCEFVSISPRVSKMLDDFEKQINAD